MPRYPQLLTNLCGLSSLRPDREHCPTLLLCRILYSPRPFLVLCLRLLHLRLLYLLHLSPSFQYHVPPLLLGRILHRSSPVSHRLPRHPPSIATSPSRLVIRRTVLPSVPPCKRA